MKLTLLEIVQDMLTATDSENVNSVGHTEDAGMCVNIANREFEKLISKYRWRHTRGLGKLSVTSNLNEMVLPPSAIAIVPDTLYYSGDRVYYMEPSTFLLLHVILVIVMFLKLIVLKYIQIEIHNTIRLGMMKLLLLILTQTSRA